ncbi:sigma 54 modulation/S30EA ribosomal C-terminal domain-containing protein [Nocardia sp. NPDC019255]|uniref:sigma 54 modulation/S30EA ribosomal C-terminal domain-containing protein n=1 Tax=unclassified Nocardia TaxID=2637762 RepID=UPI0033D5A29E
MSLVSEAWSSTSFPEVAVFAAGRVPALERERFAGTVCRLLSRFPAAGSARLRITGPDHDDGPMVVQVNLSVGGTPARIQTLARRRGDALPTLVRLERQIKALQKTWEPRPWPDPGRRPLDAPGPGELVRRKVVALMTCGLPAAAAIMDAMDYDAHLFTDAETGEDAVVHRAGPFGLRMARQHSVHTPPWIAGTPGLVTINPRPAPELTETRAVARVCEYGLPSLFYTDSASGRGRLMYRRYDGGLTLVAPADRIDTVTA